jgi:peroxiredoxin
MEFQAKEELPYALVSDPSRDLTGKLGILMDGAERGLIATRVTYLLNRDGMIVRIWEVGAGDAIDVHPDEVLAAVRAS